MMAIHLHGLEGCRPTPLAHYLKALGVLRLVSEQADPSARGFWKDEQFWLLTKLDREALLRFFLDEVSPTPLVSPWNKGSGFYAGKSGVPAIEASPAPRFRSYREGITAAKRLLGPISEADENVRVLKEQTRVTRGMSSEERREAARLKKDPDHKARLAEAERRFKTQKNDLLPWCRREWRSRHLEWMNAAVVLTPGEDPSFPSLLGTGGNDGRLDFTNNFMQRWAELVDLDTPDAGARPHARPLLERALFSTPAPAEKGDVAIGQFHPGAAGGANATTGPAADSRGNPWDFILALEGSILIQARATRRLDATAGSKASAPFAFFSQVTGYASGGGEKASRGEQWLPVWSSPSSLGELKDIFGEARMRLGTGAATRPVDALRALSRLGTARGLDGFVRYGYLERQGQSNLAIPLGRLAVRTRPEARLVDDIGPWLDRLDRTRNAEHCPASLQTAVKNLSDAVFTALSQNPTPSRWEAVLVAAARVECLQARGTGFEAGPIPRLTSGWLQAVDDGSPEVRLALALARACADPSKSHDPARGGVRRHALPIDDKGRFRTSDDGKRLLHASDFVMSARDLTSDLLALLRRRSVEKSEGGFGLRAQRNPAAVADVARFIQGDVDDRRILDLARAFMALDGPSLPSPRSSRATDERPEPEPSWWLLRLALAGEAFEPIALPTFDPAILRRGAAGDGPGAVQIAARRLAGRGLRPVFAGTIASPELARRWTAALAFPLSAHAYQLAAGQLDPRLIIQAKIEDNHR